MASSDYGYGADPSYYGDYTGGYTGTMSGSGGVSQPAGGGGMRGAGAGGGQPGGHGGAAAYGYGYGGMGHGGYGEPAPSPLDAEIQVVCREIQTELHTLEQSGDYGEQFKNARRLLTTEANKLENNIDPEWLEVDINKPIKVTKKVLIPSFRHPKFNFVGKVLGPKGATLQNIAKHFKCHVYILGRGSTRDRAKEHELLQSGDPQFAHYGGPLHVKVETTAAPAVAYQRVAGVLDVLTQLLVPVKDTHIEGITTVGEGGGGGEKDGEDSSKQDGGDEGGTSDENGGGPPKNGGASGGYRGGGMRGGPPRGGAGGGSGFRGGFGGSGPGRGTPRGGGGGFRGGPGGGPGRGGPRGGGVGGPMRGGHRGGPRGGGFKPY